MMNSETLNHAMQVIDADIAAINAVKSMLDTPAFQHAVELLSTCQGKALITGSGTSGSVAHRAAHLFSVAGTPAFFLPPSDGLHGGLGVLTSADLVLAFSKGGSSAELNDFCLRAKSMSSHLIVVTASPTSDLAQMADCVLHIPLATDCDLGGVIATGSSLAFSAITDVLVEMARCARGYSWESFFYTHPAGAVGKEASRSLERLHENGQE